MEMKFDVVVVGAGHAGCEAATAAARLGASTLLLTMDMNKIAQMSCNPAIGGIAKGQIVREIDALGGWMGVVTDDCAIQFRMLNRSKGPAMWSPRAQCDRGKYIWRWREVLENQPNLHIWQDQAMELLTDNVTHEGIDRLSDGRGSEGSDGCGSEGNSGRGSEGSDGCGSEGNSGRGSEGNGGRGSEGNVRVRGVRTLMGVDILAPTVVVCAGTFLNGLMHIGSTKIPGGRVSEPASTGFGESIARCGITVGRMKTGTPVRIDGRTVHFDELTRQDGDIAHVFSQISTDLSAEQATLDNNSLCKSAQICGQEESNLCGSAQVRGQEEGNLYGSAQVCGQEVSNLCKSAQGCGQEESKLCKSAQGCGQRFSFLSTDRQPLPQLPCWTLYTTQECHDVLRAGLPYSPLYNGQIQSIGPRYCPSIETKLVTFPDREQHQLFLEPEGTDTQEYYLNGFSSSLPLDVQLAALRKIPALRDVEIYRPGYAIEYDFFDPTQLRHTLESKVVAGLYLAGQVNGTTGYEEAAGQGLVAGANAALRVLGREPFVMRRDESYIGVLIDDLVTKGVDEPYRMFTSRAEFRILLRQDNADERLTERGYRVGLVSQQRYDEWLKKRRQIEELLVFTAEFSVKPERINDGLRLLSSTPLVRGCRLVDLIGRPELDYRHLSEYIPALRSRLSNLPAEVVEAAEIRIKYSGYIRREREYADKMVRLEGIRIAGKFHYAELQSLSTEARQKLERIQPETLAQASRIPGVSPSDINVLLVLLGR